MSRFLPHRFRLFFNWRGWVLFFLLLTTGAFSQGLGGEGDHLQPDYKMTGNPRKISIMQAGRWRIEYDLANGVADILCDGKILIPRTFAVVRLPETVTSADYQTRKVTRQTIHDGFGRGVKFTVESANGGADKMIQTFWLYEKLDYLLADVEIVRKPGASSNFMSPLTTQTPVDFPPDGDNRALSVPFDNDKWVRYDAVPFGTNVTSHEVSALYDNTGRRGLVIGSIEHDVWKTGVSSTTSSNVITGLQIFGGNASDATHDVLPHGKISGETIRSPKIFIGSFSDWRTGLETYAAANAVVAPPRAWPGGVPFGWNSWGKLQGKISFAKAVQVSDFFAKELPGFQNDGVAYIGLDSGWTKFSDDELKQFVDHCQANHQAAGIYFTPFAAFGWHSDDEDIPGTDYRYKDIYLYANGQKQALDGGVALDPTHPGTKELIARMLDRFQQAGFKYIKADFLAHGTLESDRHFDPQVTTGIQAYNAGMKFVAETAGKKMYLNEAISPLFPAQYSNSRRIACDAFGGIGEVEYELNSLTYGWWLARVYDYNDPDHVVLDGFREGENRARVTSAVITGLFISGDDFSDKGKASGKERAKSYLVNQDMDALARSGKSFQPVEGNTGSAAAGLFTRSGADGFYLAVLNYSNSPANVTVDLARAGLPPRQSYQGRELWSGESITVSNRLTIDFKSADAVVYKLSKDVHKGN
jgi:alpha-galactosidase